MAYVSLYRKYRPQTFADVMGQEHVTRTLQNAIRSGHIAHGYLFTGTRGTAKTTIARLLAKALNCDRGPAPEPCNQCDACVSITNGSCIDVIEMDAASHRGVADIEEVRKAVGYGPMQFRYKVFIIDEAHQLSSDAKDAFLKTLEEPPDNVVFILATTEPQAIPITIRSRCQQFDFKRGSLADIAARLRYVLEQEGVGYIGEAVNLVARNAEGSWRDALSLLEQVLAFSPAQLTPEAVDTVLGTLDAEMLTRVVEAVATRDAPTVFALAGELLDAGKEARTLLRTLSAHFRDLLLVSVGGPAVALELTPEEVGRLQTQAKRFTPPQMMRAMDILNEAQGETRWNNQHRLLVELTFLKLMDLGDGAAKDASAFATAPIVFPAAAPVSAAPEATAAAPPTVALPPVAPTSVPSSSTEPSPMVGASAAPVESAEPETQEREEMPTSYFAGDGRDAEDDYADEDDLVVESAAVPVEPEPEGPGLFNEEETPAAPSPALQGGVADASQELAAVMTPGRSAAVSSAPEEELDLPGDGSISVDRVVRAWPRFLQEAERISKQASVMLTSALPTAVSGKAIVVTFASRPNYEMMSLPKKQEFVRKLLARSLGLDRVEVRFALDPNVTPPRPAPRQKERRERDLVAAIDHVPPPPASAGDFARPAAPSAFAAEPPRTGPTPEPARTMPAATANGGGEPVIKARPAEAVEEDPLVQEALSIFGGEIVDGEEKG